MTFNTPGFLLFEDAIDIAGTELIFLKTQIHIVLIDIELIHNINYFFEKR
jgi:hypothetical protein